MRGGGGFAFSQAEGEVEPFDGDGQSERTVGHDGESAGVVVVDEPVEVEPPDGLGPLESELDDAPHDEFAAATTRPVARRRAGTSWGGPIGDGDVQIAGLIVQRHRPEVTRPPA